MKKAIIMLGLILCTPHVVMAYDRDGSSYREDRHARDYEAVRESYPERRGYISPGDERRVERAPRMEKAPSYDLGRGPYGLRSAERKKRDR